MITAFGSSLVFALKYIICGSKLSGNIGIMYMIENFQGKRISFKEFKM